MAQYVSQCGFTKFKTVAIFTHRGHFNQEKLKIFRQLTSSAGSVQSFMLAQKCRHRISEFCPEFTFLLEQE